MKARIVLREDFIVPYLKKNEEVPLTAVYKDAGQVINVIAVGNQIGDSPFVRSNLCGIGVLYNKGTAHDDIINHLADKNIMFAVWYNGKAAKAWVNKEGEAEEANIIIIPQQEDFFKRLRGVVDVSYLNKKTVTIIGMGTGGSKIAVELVRSGLGRLNLIDYDIIEVVNVVRHVCTISDVGRYKTLAVKDILTDINPHCDVNTYEINVREEYETMKEIMAGSDLVIESTGVPETCSYINNLAIHEEVPVIFGGAYERAVGGYVLRYLPGETPCYNCVFEAINNTGPSIEMTEEMRRQYSTVTDTSELRGEPGMSIDTGFLALLHSKMAVTTLLRDTDSELMDFTHDFLLWANQPWGGLFKRPLTYKMVSANIREDCASCQKEVWERKQLEQLGRDTDKQGVDQDVDSFLKDLEKG